MEWAAEVTAIVPFAPHALDMDLRQLNLEESP